MLHKIFNRSVRMWVYGVAIAFVPLALYFGWIDAEASVMILPLIMAILNINTPEEDGERGVDVG